MRQQQTFEVQLMKMMHSSTIFVCCLLVVPFSNYAQPTQEDLKNIGKNLHNNAQKILGQLTGNGRPTEGPGRPARDMSKCADWASQISSHKGGRDIPSFCFLDNKNLSVNTDQVTKLVKNLGDPRAILNVIKSAGGTREKAEAVIDRIKQQIKELSLTKLKAAVGPLIELLGGAKDLTPADIQRLGRSLVEKMPPDFIKKLSDTSFDEVLKEVFHGARNRSQGILLTSEGMAMCQSAFQRYRDINTDDQLNRTLPLLPCAPVPVCDSIPAVIVRRRLAEISQLPWTCPSSDDENDDEDRGKLRQKFPQMIDCAKSLIRKVLADKTNVTADDFNSLGRLKSCMDKGDLLKLIDQQCPAIREIVSDIKLGQFAQVKKKWKTKCAKRAQQQPENITTEDIREMGPIATELSKDVLKRMNQTALCGTEFKRLLLKEKKAPEETRRVVAKRCYKDKVVTASDIITVGADTLIKLDVRKLRESVKKEDLDDEAKEELKRSVKDTKDPRKKVIRRVILDKLSVKDLVDSPRIMREMPLSRLKSEVTDVRRDLGLDDNSTEVDLPDTINKWGVRKLLAGKGADSLTLEDLKEMRTLVRGLLSEHIDNLNKTDMFSRAVVLCQHTNWPGKSVRAVLRKLIVPALEEESPTNYMSSLTVTDVSVLGCECLMHFRPKDLEAASKEVCTAICEKVGSCDEVRCLNPRLRTKLKDTCLKCLGKDQSGTIMEEDLDTLGQGLAPEMVEEISRVDATALKNRISLFRRGCIRKRARDLLISKVKQALGSAGDVDSSRANQAGDLITVYAKEGTLGDITNDSLVEAAPEILEDFDPTDESAQRYQQCCMDGLDETERQERKDLRQSVLAAIKDVIDRRAGGSRRKRAAGSWTCDDIMSMGSSVTTATLTDIQAITNTEFSNCLGTLGQYSDWTAEQRNALLERVKMAVGAVCDLTSSDLVNLGSIALSLTTSDISCLQLTEDDPVAALGALSGWTNAQRTALASRFLSQRSPLTVATLEGTHVSLLGHILCGLPAADLRTLTSAAFNGASAEVGRLMSCPVEHLQALKTVASRSDTFGAVTTWGADTLSELGTIVAGLNSGELQGLSNSSIEGIKTHGIKLIPAGILKAMSAAQLESFSPEQAQAVSSAQRGGLSLEQRNSLQRAEFGEYATIEIADDTKPSKGSRSVGAIVSVILLTISASLLHQ